MYPAIPEFVSCPLTVMFTSVFFQPVPGSDSVIVGGWLSNFTVCVVVPEFLVPSLAYAEIVVLPECCYWYCFCVSFVHFKPIFSNCFAFVCICYAVTVCD